MKTKRTMRTLSVVLATIFAASVMLFSSCSQSPDSYQDEIEDYVKYDIAIKALSQEFTNNELSAISLKMIIEASNEAHGLAMLSALGIGEHILFELSDTIETLYVDNELITYREIIENFTESESEKYSKLCIELLETYDNYSIALSEYTEIGKSSNSTTWQFEEANSEQWYNFTINEEGWGCSPELTLIDFISYNLY